MNTETVLGGEDATRFEVWLGDELALDVSVLNASKLVGGAIQENWAVDCSVGGAPRRFVVRRDAPSFIRESHTRRNEFALLNAAHQAGVRVPRPIAFCEDPTILGSPFAIISWVDGVGLGPRIVKDFSLGGDRIELARELGRQLALIHSIRPPREDLSFLGKPPSDPLRSEVERLRRALDVLGVERPVLEWGLAQMNMINLPLSAICLTHRDFRTGNYLVDEKGLTAILDWEFAGWGDPMADLGWVCAECWRFGRLDLDAGGIGPRTALYEGYASGGGVGLDDRIVRVWEILAHLRWAVIALQQGARHLSGAEPSLELALTGRIVREVELSVIRATAPGRDELRGWP